MGFRGWDLHNGYQIMMDCPIPAVSQWKAVCFLKCNVGESSALTLERVSDIP